MVYLFSVPRQKSHQQKIRAKPEPIGSGLIFLANYLNIIIGKVDP